MEKNDFISIWLEENGNPAIKELTEMNMDLAARAVKTLAYEGLSENDLAVSLDINPDKIKRWLTGRHSFSINMIKKISETLATKQGNAI
ncbi:helix-turn-helix domain-containing protein [Pedobacter frigoris]|uniref:Helix-turn-helix transcriptional regulator n=1 Tax=Pedobacter frigoris TaxID=2571272 RepID=A0A4V5P043_9SPHI|nr:helix-turn-helix transcriptional regulator [Pedobacter frigoris]TKC09422.1 helix-turn-helix transcriptional regulator [Pedobacter frigoris]